MLTYFEFAFLYIPRVISRTFCCLVSSVSRCQVFPSRLNNCAVIFANLIA